MKLSRLLEEDRKFESRGLAGSFGDGYLVAKNPYYRRVREAASAAGFRFSPERDEAYETFPLLRLESLLAKKILPYSRNMAALGDLSPAQREALDWEDLDGNLKKNFVFHEACHGVVRGLVEKHLDPVSLDGSVEAERRFALRMLLEESCSNACELLGSTEAADPTHRIFYEMNSYICEFGQRTNFRNAVADMGGERIATFMILAYLESNFLRERIDEKDLQRILHMTFAAAPSAKDQKTLRALSKVAFHLNERFRFQTTGFHLRLAGIKTPMEELFGFDFLKALEGEKGWKEFLDAVASVFTADRPR